MIAPEGMAGQKIGVLIRKRRRQLHLTLQQLGEKSGISYSYLSQVERDNATPTLGTLAQVAQVRAAASAGRARTVAVPLIFDDAPRLAFAHADWSGYSIFEEAFTLGDAAGAALA